MRLHVPALVIAGLLAAAPAPAALARGWHDEPEDGVVVGPDLEDHLEEEDEGGFGEDDRPSDDAWLEDDGDWADDGDPQVDPGIAPPASPPGTTPKGGRDPRVPYGRLIAATARRRTIPVALFTALVWQESAFKPRARSHAGARGLTQLMPATARMLGVRKIYDPQQNLDGGARYLRSLLTKFRGSKRLALAGYNAGPGAVQRFRGVPPYAETRRYVTRILARERQLRAQGVR